VSTYTLKEQKLPLDDSWDVIVAGGGPSGCTAAIAAAREGAKTLLIESMGALGGMGTLGLVPAWCPYSDGEQIIHRGLALKVFDACKQGMPVVDNNKWDWVAIDPELLKRIYDDMVTESGATVLFGTSLAAVDATENGEVNAIITSSKAGLQALKAKVYIDCTGDADLCVWAGADYEKGNANGELQPATHCFQFSNVDSCNYLNGGRPPHQLVKDIALTGKYPRLNGAHLCNSLLGPGTVGFNAGHIWDVDNTDPVSISKALIQGRKMAVDFRTALAEAVPQTFANAFIVATGALMGIRETRRVIGDYVVTIDDFIARKTFDDEICRNAYPVDIHCAKDEKAAHDKGEVSAMTRHEAYEKGESHGIPYRSLIPAKLKNVLVAGRSISTDRDVQGSTRVMPPCLCMGEAAGLAAAMAVPANGDVRSVDTDKLRGRLREEDAYLP